ncbi:MAG: BspA family leucine-rich repeat surface protein, partial [Spirochaetota bacterium]
IKTTAMTITWTKVTDATAYRLYYSAKKGFLLGDSQEVKVTENKASVTGLKPLIKYYFRVVAANPAKWDSAVSDEAGPFATKALGTLAPAKGLKASAVSESGFTLSWQPVANAASYAVHLGTSEGGKLGSLHATIDASAKPSYSFSGRTAGAPHFLQVLAHAPGYTSSSAATAFVATRIRVQSKAELVAAIGQVYTGYGALSTDDKKDAGTASGATLPLTHIDTSALTDMSGLFKDKADFNGDVSNWDTARVSSMAEMFKDAAKFNGDISGWNTGQVRTLRSTFEGAAKFNGDVAGWDTRKVYDMQQMFKDAAAFTRDLSSWTKESKVRKVAAWGEAFQGAGNTQTKKQPKWNRDFFGSTCPPKIRTKWPRTKAELTTMVTNMANDNQDDNRNANNSRDVSDKINTSAITDMSGTLASNGKGYESGVVPNGFDKTLECWDVSNVRTMAGMFASSSKFNQDLSMWKVGNVTDMSNMFAGAQKFDQSLANWDVSNVTSMNAMFSGATIFNQDLSSWAATMGQITNMDNMFFNASTFNQDLSAWNVSNVTSMKNMFQQAKKFNNGGKEGIQNWDVSKVTNMAYMFSGSPAGATVFNQPIGTWDVSGVT